MTCPTGKRQHASEASAEKQAASLRVNVERRRARLSKYGRRIREYLMEDQSAIQVYRCRECQFWHVGNDSRLEAH